jgi:hypothetical protein
MVPRSGTKLFYFFNNIEGPLPFAGLSDIFSEMSDSPAEKMQGISDLQ